MGMFGIASVDSITNVAVDPTDGFGRTVTLLLIVPGFTTPVITQAEVILAIVGSI
jgi:hypothetical protein